MVHGLLSRSPQAFPVEPQAPVAQGIEHSPSKRARARSNRAGGTEPFHHRRVFTDAEFDALAPRFWSKVDRSGGLDACWPWTKARGRTGYGQWHPFAKVHTPAHRFALALKLGRNIAPDEVAMHLCHNPPCCNPTHLKEGSYSQNMQHSADDGRAFVGQLNAMAALTEAQVIDLRARAVKEYRPGWFAERGRELGVASSTIARVVHGKDWAHLPGAVLVGGRYLGKPLPPRGYCHQGHKKTAAGNCLCRTLAQREYRLRRIARAAEVRS